MAVSQPLVLQSGWNYRHCTLVLYSHLAGWGKLEQYFASRTAGMQAGILKGKVVALLHVVVTQTRFVQDSLVTSH